MVDFKKLVESLLCEASVGGILTDIYKDPNSFALSKAKMDQHFNINQFPPESPFLSLVHNNFVRATAGNLENYARYFPVIDLLLYAAESKLIGTGKGADFLNNTLSVNGSQIDDIDQDFASKFDASVTGGNPFFDYIPLSSKGGQAHLIISKSLSKMVIGRLALENFYDFSIKRAIYGLLEGHRKLKLSIFRGKDQTPSSIKYVDDILLNPNKYAAGKTQIPAQFKALYDNVSVKELVSIAVTATKLFNSEATRLSVTHPKTTLDNFISNEPLDKDKKFVFVNEPPSTSPTNILADPTPGENGYTIANIKKLNTPQSRELIKELEEFGNYIKEGEPKDWAGAISGATQVAKGLSLGT